MDCLGVGNLRRLELSGVPGFNEFVGFGSVGPFLFFNVSAI